MQRGSKVSFGEFGLKATTRGRLTARQIEAARRAMTRHIKEVVKFGLGISDVPITKKPLEVRQGKGKGNVEYWVKKYNLVKFYMKWKVFKRMSPGKLLN